VYILIQTRHVVCAAGHDSVEQQQSCRRSTCKLTFHTPAPGIPDQVLPAGCRLQAHFASAETQALSRSFAPSSMTPVVNTL
jgi:hypothetical protein